MEVQISRAEARRQISAFLKDLGTKGWTLHVQHSEAHFFVAQKKSIAKEKTKGGSTP
jgi:hypothetical protein